MSTDTKPGWIAGIDVGGTFTDLIAIDTASGAVRLAKVPTTPQNQAFGVLAAIESGHWINLRHIWGDATCGTDQVTDTPSHNAANYGCPTAGHVSTCSGAPVEMTMNYMDYTDDACMYMFTVGQKDRARAIFATGGPRAAFVK